ncbi:MAG: protein kinase [Lentisphaeria bacterium]|nr:protein kinase [Lentisphaeria bacterium]
MKLYCDACAKPITPEIPEGAAAVPCPLCGKEIPVPEKNVAPGVVIGDFLIEKPLSHGGMGEVFVARQLSLDRPVALKVLRDKFSGDKEYIDGLFREARAAAKLTNPHIVQAYAVGEEDGIYYFAMELIRGETFKQILKREKILDFAKAAKVIREICSALEAAWKDQKLVHQDIKPDNIMLDANGSAKLADLGLARTGNDAAADADADEVLGTPQYISPEQLTGVPTDVRSDIYSLGATFYQFVTGQFPYVADTAEEMSRMHVEGNLTPPKEVNPQLPDALNDIIVKMMARNIEQRYQMPNEIIRDLDAFLNNPSGRPAVSGGGLLKKPVLSRPAAPAGLPGMKKPLTPGGAKPAMPGLKTPATGAKPLLGKPAAPAVKPAVPAAKPAVPAAKATAKPAVPAVKPAAPAVKKEEEKTPTAETPPVPAEEVKMQESPAPAPEPPAAAPAETPADTPAPAEEKAEKKAAGDEITLAPETHRKAREQKAAPEGEEAKTPENGEEEPKKKKTRRTKEENAPKKRSGALKTVIFLLVLLLLLGGAAAGFFFAAKADKLPAKLKPWGEKLLAKLGQTPQAAADEKEAKTAPQAAPLPEAPVKPKEPEKPKTRPEYIRTLEALRTEFRNTPSSGRAKWLAKADETIDRLGDPVTPEEHDILCKTWAMYSIADEELRFIPAREKARAAYEKAAEQRRLQKEKEEQERQKHLAGEAARQREIAQQNAQFQQDQKARQAEINIRFAKLKNELDALNKPLILAVVQCAESKNNAAFETALENARNYLIPTTCDTIAERAAIAAFNTLKTYAPSALAAYEKFLLEAENCKARGTLMIRVHGSRILVRVTGIGAKGVIRYRTTNGTKGEYLPQTTLEYAQLIRFLTTNTHLTGVEFYYGLLSRKLAPATLKRINALLPDAKVRNFWITAARFYAASLR